MRDAARRNFSAIGCQAANAKGEVMPLIRRAGTAFAVAVLVCVGTAEPGTAALRPLTDEERAAAREKAARASPNGAFTAPALRIPAFATALPVTVFEALTTEGHSDQDPVKTWTATASAQWFDGTYRPS